MLQEIEVMEVLDVTTDLNLPRLKEVEEEEWPTISGGELKEEAVTSELQVDEGLDQQGSIEQLNDPLVGSLERPLPQEDASLSIPGFKYDTQSQHSNHQKKPSKNQSSSPSQDADSLGELRFADSDE